MDTQQESRQLIEERIKQAEEQLAYWRREEANAGRQGAMWLGALEALRGLFDSVFANENSETPVED